MREKLIDLIWHTNTTDTSEEIADHLIANGVTIQEWIPVSERLPKYGSDIITYGGDGCVRVQTFYGVFEKIIGTRLGEITVDKATHWMPLPKAPGEEDA